MTQSHGANADIRYARRTASVSTDVEISGPFFCARKEVRMSFKHKLSVRLALMKDQPLHRLEGVRP